MSKRFFGLLLVLCMVVGLLPVVALADATDGKASIKFGFSTYTTAGFDTPVYIKNKTSEVKDTAGNDFTATAPAAGTADEWNAKWEWKSGDKGPTLTLKGFKYDDWNNETEKMKAIYDSTNEEWKTDGVQTYAIQTPKKFPTTIVVTGEDSLIETKFGITYYDDLYLKSEGNAKLTMHCQSSTLSSNNTEGADLNINANLDLKIRSYYGSALGGAMIQSYKANLTIDGGNITINTDADASISAIRSYSSGDVIINGGTIKTKGAVGTSATQGDIHSVAGKVIVNGGDLTVTPKHCLGFYGEKGIEVNGGKVKIISPYYAMNVGKEAALQLNGGTLEIMAEKAFYGSPKIGTKVAAYAGANRDNCEIFDGSDTNLAKKPWFLASDTERIEITEPEEETMPIFSAPAATTPAGTTAPTQAPAGNDATTAPTAGADKTDSDSSSSNNTILLIAIVAVVVIAGAAVAVIIIKRKKS